MPSLDYADFSIVRCGRINMVFRKGVPMRKHFIFPQHLPLTRKISLYNDNRVGEYLS